MKDFTLKTYRSLLSAILEAGYAFYTFEDWCDKKTQGRYVILRHDVDLKAENSLATAIIEAEMGIRSTYYFRIVPQSNQPAVIKAIAELGHEIGYHYEDLSVMDGDIEKAISHFTLQLDYFRRFYPVRTICMHGSPTSKWDNRDLWKIVDYRNYGVIGEPYLDYLTKKSDSITEKTYFTDTGRMWDGARFNLRDKLMSDELNIYSTNSIRLKIKAQSSNERIDANKKNKIHSTFDLINWLKTSTETNIMITTHPQRWTDKSGEWYLELVKQNVKNVVKQLIVRRQNMRY
jgi:hypothetical protein